MLTSSIHVSFTKVLTDQLDLRLSLATHMEEGSAIKPVAPLFVKKESMSRKKSLSATIVRKETPDEARPELTSYIEPDADEGKLSPYDLVDKITKSTIVFNNYKHP